MTREDLAAWLRLQLVPGVGLQGARKLLAVFGLPQDIFSQSKAALTQVIGERLSQALLSAPESELETLLNTTWGWLEAADSGGPMRYVCSLADADYPRSLLTLADPPLLLYATGASKLFEEIATKSIANDMAIVGSRNATPQGLQNARSFAKSFAQAGAHIVSGLALGIDGAAHEGALDAQLEMGSGVGSTIAIVGTGLDRVYPKRHHDLAHRIVQRGLILSEFPIGTPPLAENFPRRNRLIAALTQGTLVVEAAIQSGSLITARQALDLGKEVFAIPGSIHNPQSKGCHHLIKQGAKLVESAQDVLEELPLPLNVSAIAIKIIANNVDSMPASSPKYLKNPPLENTALLQALGHDPVNLDTLIERTGIPAASLQVQLLELELAGQVARLAGSLFQRQMTA
jgi:DNA processing protein